MSGHLLVVGSVNADIYCEIKNLPQPGETMDGKGGYVLPGGKGANQAVGAARTASSCKVLFAGSFGNDNHATMLRSQMTGHNVDLSVSSTAPVPSGQAFILLQQGGQNSIIIIGGANQEWPSPLEDKLVKAIKASRGVLLQREVPEAINLQVAQLASQAGVPVYMDVGGEDSPLAPAIFPHIFLLSPNETELARVSGLPTDTNDQIIVACKKLQKLGVKNVLVTLGTRGSIFVNESGRVYQAPSFKAAKVVDTTGAGDCYRAAFAVYLTENGAKDVEKAMLFASAASCLCVQKKGAMDGMPSRAEIQKFLDSLPKQAKL
mmetsp:Transcript_43494/g.85144  ORF Transcript_43494/g.85144 Transcript_43494/m.85144 type:complete len:319 (+) Transcript_43494:31-987(+)|eukprot:CAMPEP_0175151104 /NCGR_PEP_ID=MMETSP0087-20121206/18290_1 /TAXON_ID=136419 /ORGANISM="Unknown Unknown, Strain D1" /LENGTH=318 /DNA_ID=CAMNT_0016437223 /DNA_START=26 /DNA_END=982 /DNA_ORIENTATION=+